MPSPHDRFTNSSEPTVKPQSDSDDEFDDEVPILGDNFGQYADNYKTFNLDNSEDAARCVGVLPYYAIMSHRKW